MENSLSPPAHLSVAIVLYSSSVDLLRGTLNSLFRSVERARLDGVLSSAQVHVVDNTLCPDYAERVRHLLSECPGSEGYRLVYCAADSNDGFGGGNNRVMPSLTSDAHLILNPDVELAESTLSIALTRLQQDTSIALLSPYVSGDDGRQEYLCKRYPSVFVLLLRAFAPDVIHKLFRTRLHHYEMRDVCSGSEEVDVMLASGCFMLVRTEMLLAVSGFDERYFLYFEDFDLSLRLGRLGRLVFHPAVKIVHHGGYAASKGLKHVGLFMRSGIRFFADHGWRWI
ncbi:MAG: glycosyltransferase [Halioglobus sp.]